MKRKMIRHKLFAAVLAAGCFCCAAGISASAVSVDDVANKARELGFPEAQVQQGYAYWSTGDYTQEDLNAAWAYLMEMEKESQEKFDSIFEDNSSTAPTQPSTTTGGGSADSSAADSTTAPTEATKPVTSADFINMTLEEKIAYVNSMTPEDKETFLNNLSPEERKSIMKQMSLDDKADLMEGYIGFAESMGMHVSVDNLTNENISLTIRDENGVVIDQSAVGITIDETGISHTGLFATAAAGVLLAVCGFGWLYRCLCRSDEQAQ